MPLNFYELSNLINKGHGIKENKKQALMLVRQGKISQENFQDILRIDPSPTKKFTGWMSKQWALGNVSSIDDLRNTIEEFNVFLDRGKTKKKDIYQYSSFKELKNEVEILNNTGSGTSLKELEEDYEVIRDDGELLVIVPHTHEASRKLGLSKFSYRNCGQDSAWCTTYKAPNHFNSYYYKDDHTLYYVKVMSEKIKQELINNNFEESFFVTAVVVSSSDITAYDGTDSNFSGPKLQSYLRIIGLE
jgi:hypothetical protein